MPTYVKTRAASAARKAPLVAMLFALLVPVEAAQYTVDYTDRISGKKQAVYYECEERSPGDCKKQEIVFDGGRRYVSPAVPHQADGTAKFTVYSIGYVTTFSDELYYLVEYMEASAWGDRTGDTRPLRYELVSWDSAAPTSKFGLMNEKQLQATLKRIGVQLRQPFTMLPASAMAVVATPSPAVAPTRTTLVAARQPERVASISAGPIKTQPAADESRTKVCLRDVQRQYGTSPAAAVDVTSLQLHAQAIQRCRDGTPPESDPVANMNAAADRIAAAGGYCRGIGGQMRQEVRLLGPAHPDIARLFGLAHQYGCIR